MSAEEGEVEASREDAEEALYGTELLLDAVQSMKNLNAGTQSYKYNGHDQT